MTGVVEEQPVTKIPIAPESSTASVQRCIEFTPWFSPETTPLRSMQRGEDDPPPAKGIAPMAMISAMRISLLTVIGRSNGESCKIPTNPHRIDQEGCMVLRKQ